MSNRSRQQKVRRQASVALLEPGELTDQQIARLTEASAPPLTSDIRDLDGDDLATIWREPAYRSHDLIRDLFQLVKVAASLTDGFTARSDDTDALATNLRRLADMADRAADYLTGDDAQP